MLLSDKFVVFLFIFEQDCRNDQYFKHSKVDHGGILYINVFLFMIYQVSKYGLCIKKYGLTSSHLITGFYWYTHLNIIMFNLSGGGAIR